jgi:hypothetical protein
VSYRPLEHVDIYGSSPSKTLLTVASVAVSGPAPGKPRKNVFARVSATFDSGRYFRGGCPAGFCSPGRQGSAVPKRPIRCVPSSPITMFTVESTGTVPTGAGPRLGHLPAFTT